MQVRKGDLLILVVLLLIGLIAGGYWLVNRSKVQQGNIAVLEVDGQVVKEFNLDKENVTYVVETNRGKNVLAFSEGMVRVVEADCPDQICVHFGWAKRAGQTIVCLPHKVVIKIVSEQSGSGLDGVTY